MGWLSDVFGSGTEKKQRAAYDQAYQDSIPILEAGKTAARNELTSGLQNQLASLGIGYTGARDDINRGLTSADNLLVTGFGNARDDVNAGYDSATGYLSPLIASGLASQALVDAATGAKGADAQREYYEQYADANNPLTAYRDEQANRALQQQFNASPAGSQGGRFMKAVASESLERRNADVQANVDRLERGATRGGQYSAKAADLEANRGTTLGNLSAQEGTARGDLAFRGNAALGDLSYRYGGDQANLQGGNAAQLAALESGTANTIASNRLNLGTAKAGTYNNTGFKNLVGLGGTVISAMTPTPYGSAASRLWNGLGSLGSTSGTVPRTPGDGGFQTTWNKLSGWNPLNWGSN